MLINPSNIVKELKAAAGKQSGKPQPAKMVESENEFTFVDDPGRSLTRAIGQVQQGKTVHYYSYGNFNLVRLIIYLVKQTGPVHVFMTSYSFSQKSIEQLKRRLISGELLSFKVIVDNRVRTMSPKPFQMLSKSFNYRCSSIHAKVALIWNNQWNLSVVTSQNATDNPKMERGSIFTSKEVFDFDYKALENEFNAGTT
jgi:hypothetical protein